MSGPVTARFERMKLEQLAVPRLRSVYDLWEGKRGRRRAPARGDFDPAELRPVLPCVTLVDVRRDPLDFVYRLVGTEMVRSYGRDVTGMALSEMQPEELRSLIRRDLSELVETWQPQFTALYFTNPQGHLRAYRLLRLPLSSDGERVDMILLVAEFDISSSALAQMIDDYRAPR